MTDYTYDERIFSDLYKDAHGFRPNVWHEFYTTDDPKVKQDWWDLTCEILENEMKLEKVRHETAARKFEELIDNMLKLGAKDRDQAIHWVVAGEDGDYIDFAQTDPSYICYLFDLPYSMDYIREFARIFSPSHWSYIQAQEQEAYDDTFSQPT